MARTADRRGKPQEQVKLAAERIAILFDEAGKVVSSDAALADRYVRLARKISMRYNVKTTTYRRQYCRSCKAYLKPGVTSRHSIKKSYINIKCLKCGHIMRIPMKRKSIK